jgi:hypothetical protein
MLDVARNTDCNMVAKVATWSQHRGSGGERLLKSLDVAHTAFATFTWWTLNLTADD